MRNVEMQLIFVNDGSRDRSLELISEYTHKNKNIVKWGN
jgi:glycosyltransferase involved in cell wall biosynthesis